VAGKSDMFRNLKHSLSLLRIGYVLARHDALFVLERTDTFPVLYKISHFFWRKQKEARPGKRLAAALQELGPSFIKLGQSLSTRSDLISEEIAKDLADLQDNILPFSSQKARKIIEESLESTIDELYSEFEDTPVAAASIAQVHFAKTTDGKDVAVKVLRPEVRRAFENDLELFEWIADTIERRLPDYRRMRPKEMVATVRNTVHFELDLRYEAASAVELRQNMAMDEGFYVPEIDWQRTSDRVLTLERIYGTPIANIEALKAKGHDLNALLEQAAMAFFNQVFRDGFFHADMHPGNLFITDNGVVAAVDFGIMGRLDWPNRVFLAKVLRGFLVEDYYSVAKVHVDFGVVPANKSVEQFALACRAISKPILGKPLNEISVARLLAQLFRVSQDFEMRLQPQFLMLQKSMMVTEGIGRALNPDINTWKLAEPLIESWYRDNLGVQATVKHQIHETLNHLQRLPVVLDQLATAAESINERQLQVNLAEVENFQLKKRPNILFMFLLFLIIMLVGIELAMYVGLEN
jgi:ubiquinone biosynthesis protein